MSDHENLLLKLRQEASGYSPTQQKLGEFVLSDPDDHRTGAREPHQRGQRDASLPHAGLQGL